MLGSMLWLMFFIGSYIGMTLTGFDDMLYSFLEYYHKKLYEKYENGEMTLKEKEQYENEKNKLYVFLFFFKMLISGYSYLAFLGLKDLILKMLESIFG